MPTSPSSITALPTQPSRADSANFSTRADALLGALPTFVTQTNAVSSVAYSNAVESAASATLSGSLAQTAVDASGAAKWVRDTTYSIGQVAWSPANGKVYRRLIAGAGTTDPSADATNWVQVTGLWSVDGGGVAYAANTTSAAVLITQTGTGNALLVEDSANPDATPFVIDTNGRLLVGYTSAISGYINTAGSDRTPNIQQQGLVQNNEFAITNWANTGTRQGIFLTKSRGGAIGTQGAVVSGDYLGGVNFSGSDGTSFIPAATVEGWVDGTPSTNDMPGRLIFATTSDGASTPSERMRIDSSGGVGIGATSLTGFNLRLAKTITGATTSYGVSQEGVVQPDVTAGTALFRSLLITAANSGVPYIVGTAIGYQASQGTINVDSTITNQYGFLASSTLTGATNNYGFYSQISSGTGRYNFYAAGTADNYFGGPTTVSVSSASDALRITQTGVGNALVVEDTASPDSTPFVIDGSGNVFLGTPTGFTVEAGTPSLQINRSTTAMTQLGRWDATANGPVAYLTKSRSGTVGTLGGIVASGDIIGEIRFNADDGAALIRAAGIRADVDGTPGTNDMPGRLIFATTSDGASTPSERMRIDSLGNVQIGTSSGAVRLVVDRLLNSTQPASYTAGTTAAFVGSGATSSPSYVTIIAGTTGTSALFLGDTDADARGRLSYDHSTDALSLWTASNSRLTIDSSGNVNLSAGSLALAGASATIGYATGSGGSVTQLTSRTTGVTLNKAAGAITLFSATTTAGQITTFTVTNSLVAATDTIIFNQKTGSGVYLCFVTAVTAGTFNISVQTPSAVGVAEAPTINFAVIKSAAA